jgi:hypothetical protein
VSVVAVSDIHPAASLAEIRKRPWLRDRMGTSAYSQSDDAARAVPALLAAIDALTEALTRHRQWFTDSKNVRRCGGCLEPSPCPDDPDMIVERALGDRA